MIKYFALILSFTLLLQAQVEDTKLKRMIGHMLIVGFDNQVIQYNSQIVLDLQKYNLGGVILFDKFYTAKGRIKNILSPYQLQNLTKKIRNFAGREIFISLDQEGGKVARLKAKYGFKQIPSAASVANMSLLEAHQIYAKNAKMLHTDGINTNFAPVVDLAINKKNHVIVGLERSYGMHAQKVIKYAKVMIEEQKKEHVISVLKHFPGHGSSLGDSHKGFVDISDTWSKKELLPYETLINENMIEMIMSAHVFNKHLDKNYPATLSYAINTTLLREKMGYKGIIISDDMQMDAITKHYSLQDASRLAINSGVDILLFGNQLKHNSVQEIVDAIYKNVKSGKISHKRIIESNKRIDTLLMSYKIKQKPIIFKEKRINLTKKYIKDHYNLSVDDITIQPKMIVVHWTALEDFNKSFARFNPEILLSDRTDIASASALNVSTHYLIDRDGEIYQLMPDNMMARHVIGLNYSSIGIENVGGESNTKEDLTEAQLQSNVMLIKYLKEKYPAIENVIGHYAYRKYEGSELWLEKDAQYRTKKVDPGERFMKKITKALNE